MGKTNRRKEKDEFKIKKINKGRNSKRKKIKRYEKNIEENVINDIWKEYTWDNFNKKL